MPNITPSGAGDYRQRVTLLQAQQGQPNELGETTPTTVPVRTVWAKVSPISSAKRMQNGQMTLDVTHTIRMRWVPFLDSTFSIKFGNRILDILDIRDVEEQRTELELTCHEQRGSGGRNENHG
jgi:SPP1 family predicted phage head-tail adaptor